MNTDNSSNTGSPDPHNAEAGADAHAMRKAALQMKADAAGVQIEVAARRLIDTMQVQLDDVAARIAHAGGDSRNELLARQGQLRAELDLARLDLRSLRASAASAVADVALNSDNH